MWDWSYTHSICDTIILIYEIGLPPAGKTIGLNLLDDEDYAIPFFIDTIPDSSSGHQLLKQAKKMCGLLPSINKIPS